jgi:dipeptide/tripeptide permease
MLARQLLALLLVPLVLFLERLTYYGSRSVLVLFMTGSATSGGLGLEPSVAFEAYGHFTLALALVPVLGGVAGLVLGPRVALPVGMALEVLGLGLLAAAGTETGLSLALGVLVLGQALFRPNLFAVLGQELPDPADTLRSAGMVLTYGATNAGAFLAPMVFGMLATGTGFGVAFAALTAIGAFTLLLVGGLSVLGFRAPSAPASSAPTRVPGVLAVAALATLPSLTLMLGTEALYVSQTHAAGGGGAGLAAVSLNPLAVMVASGLLFGVLVMLHVTGRRLPALWLLGGGAAVALLSVVPLLQGAVDQGGPIIVGAVLLGGLAEVLVTPAALSRVSAGPSRVTALLLGVFLTWVGVLTQATSAITRLGGEWERILLGLLAFGTLGVAGVLLVRGRRLERRLFPPEAPSASGL